ncbi:sulfatase-like hydrolase/transferase [Haloarcula sp. Atlit-120R]|uniref:sulfatase-like hydrolase/transferase n=1 Tax=Haloarcula sp. Atlit-120R TaxID=2282135 RepID=UPI001314FC6E|nr:sulfatase-like hydrolase/transferase [Haloarcula sp. Atlit-120R]
MTSIAVVVLDTLRRDTFNEHFNWMPGTKFENAYSTSHWTVPAHASLFTGKYPSEIGVHGKSVDLDCQKAVIAEKLRADGYSTRMFTANPQIYMWDGWDRGFRDHVGPSNLDPKYDNLVDWEEFYSKNTKTGIRKYFSALRYCIEDDSPTIPSLKRGYELETSTPDSGASSVLKRIKSIDVGSKDFLLINLMDVHTPYYPPEEYRSYADPVNVVFADSFSDEELNKERIRTAYKDSVRYLSDKYKDIFTILSEKYDYIITLSDHGELLGEHGMWNHSYGLYQELVKIPLVVSGQNIQTKSIPRSVSILDVHQTIADLADVDVESRGENLLNSSKKQEHLFEYHGLLSWHQDQFDRKNIPEKTFNRLDTPLDGVVDDECFAREDHDEGIVVERGKTNSEDASEKIDKIISQFKRTPHGGMDDQDADDDDDVSDEVKSRLEDLGYA